MVKDFLCKAHSGSLQANYQGWLWSRKLNGFSMLWDGGISTGKPIGQVLWGKPRTREDRYTVCTGLWTGDGHIIHAPKWWYENFPRYVPLQGECWYKDNKWFSAVCNAAPKTSFHDSRWMDLRFMVYNYKPYSTFCTINIEDIPETERIYYSNLTFGARVELVNNEVYLAKNKSVLVPLVDVEQDIITVNTDLNKLLQEKTAGIATNSSDAYGWEGIMLTNPAAKYTCGRSYDLLKLKPDYDIEVEVVGHNQGLGKHSERMGSLRVKLIWNEKVLSFHGGRADHVGKIVFFNVGGGFSDAQREWEYVKDKFAYGTIIKINFNEVGENGAIPSSRLSLDWSM